VTPTLQSLREVRAPRWALWLAGAVLVVLVAPAIAPSQIPRGVVLQGAEYGTITGLLALGLVLTYRASRIINFAYGALGGLAATLTVELYLGRHWNWGLAIVVGLAAGAVIGGLIEILVVRRFFTAPRLVLTVATIGLAQVVGGFQLLIPRWVGGPPLIGSFETPLSKASTSIDPVIFSGNDLLIIAVVPLVIGGLGWFLLRTDAGIAVRAVADNGDRAMLLGIPIRRLSTLVWVLAGALAALATILGAPSQGLVLSAGAGPQLLLPALAAAVVARLESLPVAFGAGVGLGVLDALVRWNISKQSAATVAFLVVILVALLLQRRAAGRARDTDSTWVSAGTLKPIPQVLARLPEVRIGRGLVGAGVLAAAVIAPLVAGPGKTNLFSIALVYGMVAVSLVMLSGWAGQVSLGQFALVGIGGVVTGDLIMRWNVDLFVCLVAAAAAGAALAIAVGLPALRIRGLFLAVTTLALAVAVDSFFLNPTNFASLIPQSYTRPVLWQRFDLQSERSLYYLCLGMLLLVIGLVVGLRRTRPGRVMLATRDNERAAAAMAVPTTRVKLVGFVLSGAVAGVAGGLHALLLQSIGFHTYEPSQSLLVFSMAVIGGLASISGALLGVAAVELAVRAFPAYQLIITGSGLLFLLLVLPGGLGEALQLVRDRLLRIVARRRGIESGLDVPSSDLLREQVGVSEAAEVAAAVHEADDGDALLRCRGVEVSYGSVQVLFGVDFSVQEGEIVALLGTNGAGKSTLLKAVSGLSPTGGGHVVFGGDEITGRRADLLARSGMALMPGGRGVFPTLTVAENLRLAAWTNRHDAAAVEAAREEVLDLFPVLRGRADQAAGDLSGGEQQMLSLGQALMTRPKLLLIDELSLGLAPTVVGQLLDVVRRLNAAGVTVVVVEQSVNVALELAERAVFMEKGQVRFSGPTAELLERPDVLRSVFIAGAAAPGSRAPARTARRRKKEEPVARLFDPELPPILEVQSITKSFGGIRALDGIDLALRKGEILGLIGHNGAGKTTLFDVISGFLPADGGRVLLGGHPVDHLTANERAWIGLGRSFQEARLFPSLTVAETVAVSLERHLLSKDLVAAGLRLPASTDSEALAAGRVRELLAMTGLTSYAERLLSELSTGTRRIVELSCILAQDPEVVLLDEPSGGVAQRETEALGPLLRRVQDETGCSILVIEHDMPLLTGLCDRMVALELGGVIAEGTPAEVLEHPRVIESYLGTEDAAINRSGSRRAPAPA
jgi:ABC-type branched-subunit amino acid transport system ATPase component/ABC-type branched-subunit amino acid transport system permease subunit